MSRGPGIHEIFSNNAPGRNAAFKFHDQESKQQLKLSKKGSEEDSSPMKKFGGYKPKILGGQTDFIEIQEQNSSIDTSVPTLAPKSPPVHDHLQDTSSHRPQPLNSKPWVIGDKNVPMVLGSNNDADEDDNSVELHVSDSNTYTNDDYTSGTIETNAPHRTFSVSSDTSTLVRQNSDDSRQGLDNPALYSNGFVVSDGPVSTTAAQDTDIPDLKTNVVNPDDTIGVFIPPPDYDEDEKTLDFTSDDTDDPSDGGEEAKPRQNKPRPAVKVYEGADLSHYLSEEDGDQEVVFRAAPRVPTMMMRKPDTQGRKSQQKQSLFKQLSPNKSKRKSSGNAPKFNSVRSFSYADSKFGTKGKTMSKSFSSSNIGDDSDRFLSANSQQSSYESFLRSRHGDDMPSDSGNFGGDNREFGNGSALRHKDDPVWKKLTLRLKQRLSKNLGPKEQG